MQTYLNTAAFGLLEDQTIAAANNFWAELAVQASTRSEYYRFTDEPRIRKTVAGFLGAKPADIALVPNFSWAMNAVVQSLKGTERVMLYKQDFPSLLEPFRLNNFNIRWIDAEDGFTLPLDEIRNSITEREIDILAISHVQFNSGYKLDIKELGSLCKANGVTFIVDSTQSQGAMPIDVSSLDVDVLVGSNYKWMNAGGGTGIMYVSPDFIAKYPPVVAGFNSYTFTEAGMSYTPSAKSYEPGHPNMAGFLVLEAAINHKLKTGLDKIAQHNEMLTALLLAQLKDIPVQLIGPYTMENRTSFILLKDADGLSGWLKENNIVTTNRNGIVRISMHYYNTEDDIKTLVSCLKKKFF